MTAETTIASDALYRLRDDLVFVERNEGGRLYVLVKDPVINKFYGFNQTTCQVLKLLDGATPAGALPERMKAAHGRVVNASQVHDLLARAKGLGLLTSPAGDPAPVATLAPVAALPPAVTARGSALREYARRFNPFYIKFKALNPTRVLDKLEWLGRLLFSWPMYVALPLAIAAAVYVQYVEKYTLFYNSFRTFLFFDQWVIAWTILIVSGMIHELGHALACRRFGGQVREMGFLLYLLQPGMYTNVNDAWLMPRKQRIMVSLGGVYVEAIIWCAFAAVWYFARPFSQPFQVAFVCSLILMMRIAANLIPLLRLDGYFILADILGVPNLRPRSLVYVVSLVPWLGRNYRDARPISRRERIIFTTYGILSYAMLGLVMIQIVTRIRDRWGEYLWSWSLVAGLSIAAVLSSVAYVRKNRPRRVLATALDPGATHG